MSDCILISIKPPLVERIMTGVKKYEYRKYPPNRVNPVRYMLIYSTYPVQKVVSAAEVLNICENSPRAIWERTQADAGVSEEEYYAYFSNSPKAVGLHIGRIWPFNPPIKLRDLSPNLTVPQSYSWLPDDVWETVKQRLNIETNQ